MQILRCFLGNSRSLVSCLAATTLGLPAAAFAQPEATTPAADLPPAVAPAPEPTLPPPPPIASADPLQAKVEAQSKVGNLAKAQAATDKALSSLTKLKFSGYVQGRYEFHQDSKEALTDAGVGQASSQFLVRRARLKAVYTGTLAEYVLQIDATPGAVGLRDAEATLVEPWTPLGLKLTAGQFKWPFGFEVIQSSGVREMPERTRVIRVLFPSERDRGVRLMGNWEKLRFAAAVVNGEGTSANFAAADSSDHKDLVGRIGMDLDQLVFGVSGYVGENRVIDKKAVAATDKAPAAAATFKDQAKTRYGADLQARVAVPGVGDLTLRGEYILGEHGGKDVAGWYGFLMQDIAKKYGAFVRVDQYDPDTAGDQVDDRTLAVGGGLHWLASGNFKLTVSYERPMAEKDDKDDDTVTVQAQATF